jgi:hypothetical protein
VQFSSEQAASTIILDDGTVITACERCRKVYNGKTPPEEPPCDECRVELMEENKEAAMIYNLVQGQVITAGMGEPIDINHIALWEAIDRFRISNPLDCFGKVNRIFRHFLKERRRESE